jgi:hypothetical protein
LVMLPSEFLISHKVLNVTLFLPKERGSVGSGMTSVPVTDSSVFAISFVCSCVVGTTGSVTGGCDIVTVFTGGSFCTTGWWFG